MPAVLDAPKSLTMKHMISLKHSPGSVQTVQGSGDCDAVYETAERPQVPPYAVLPSPGAHV